MTKITPESCRAARCLLGWTQTQLAEAARVSTTTVKTYELGNSTPIQLTLDAFERAFSEAGVELIEEDNGGAGARLRHPRERRRAGR